jgi:hypothetical protein
MVLGLQKMHGDGELFSFKLLRAVCQICSRHCSNSGNGSRDFTRSVRGPPQLFSNA